MFVLFAIACVLAIVLLVSGRWRIDSEAVGLAVGGILVGLIWLGLSGR